ncbi:FkbM family methyltransferase [Ancylobacter oerskovii]|nr:FkbM family methyltransferase [Ancylobacter oerskovii]MBS7544718.1 FkbM family methyltransferase [Ancylobacter oerskovii]
MSERDVERVLTRYFQEGDRSEETTLLADPQLDVDMNIVDHILEKPEAHDEDYIVFRHFTDPATTILDIGANFGYSATGFWRVGAKSSIAAFEPIKGFEPILAELGRRVNARASRGWWARLRHRPKYEHYRTGISDRDDELTFHTSVINGRIQSALTTADTNPHIPSYVKNTFDYARNYLGAVETFKIHPFTSPVTTVDNWMASGVSKLNLHRIVAVKIDTEGFEGHVLVGASKLLDRQKPLIIAECGHVIDLATKTAFSHGYVFAEREGDQLRVSDRPTQRVNGFFIHPEKFSAYRQMGLLRD